MLKLFVSLLYDLIPGAAALILQANPAMTPDDVWTTMAADATPNVVSDPGFRSPNTFLYVPSA